MVRSFITIGEIGYYFNGTFSPNILRL